VILKKGELLSGRSEVRILSWTLEEKKWMRHFMPHPLFLFEARRASKGSVSASTVKYKSSAEEMFMEYFIAYWFLFNYD